jgi:UDP-N-acetylglucosamine 3-dehydrogenase
MAGYKAGIIGCGGRGKAHAQGYQAALDVEIVACADPVGEARDIFAEQFGVGQSYADYREMLEREDLDFVSVCTWTRFHKEMVVAAANSGIKAIHCEKPMAHTWGESKELYRACVDNEVVVTFCHQRRFRFNYARAKKLLDEGAIGQLIRVEGACQNLFDWGTHFFDMFFFYNNEVPAEWVIGQIDVGDEVEWFGVQVETSGVAWIRWKNGVEGLLTTGETAQETARNRLIGTEGIIEIGPKEEPLLRILKLGAKGWEEPGFDSEIEPNEDTVLSVLDLVECVKTGREPMLSGRKALQATELIFATYESSRRRARIDLPLDVDDSALLTMLEQGAIGPGRR